VKASIPLGNLNHVCPLDCIPSIDDPEFTPAAELEARATEMVIGITLNGVSKAYPLSQFREVVNDEIGGTPVVVTWCPLCGTPIALKRTLDGEPVEFGVSGKLHHNDLVLYDRKSYTLWQQVTGEAIVGPRTGQGLEMVPVDMVTYSQWVEHHPDTLVLTGGSFTRMTGERLPYEQQLRGMHQRELAAPDKRLDPYAVIYGVEYDGTSKAYPIKTIRDRAPIYDTVAGTRVAVLGIARTDFVRVINLEAGPAPERLFIEEDEIVDGSGRRWGLGGTATSADTEDLVLLNAVRSYWFGWAAFHPDTALYEG
jgi:hypothetical protein